MQQAVKAVKPDSLTGRRPYLSENDPQTFEPTSIPTKTIYNIVPHNSTY